MCLSMSYELSYSVFFKQKIQGQKNDDTEIFPSEFWAHYPSSADALEEDIKDYN